MNYREAGRQAYITWILQEATSAKSPRLANAREQPVSVVEGVPEDCHNC